MVKAIKLGNSNSVCLLINDTFTLWFDLFNSVDGIMGDFNQYIFNLNDEEDSTILDYQSLDGSFEDCFDASLEFLRVRGLVSLDKDGNEYINNL